MSLALKNDGIISIAVGTSRTSTSWKNKDVLWSELVDRLATPTRTPESCAQYKKMAKAQRDAAKDVGGFVGGTLTAGRRKTENVARRRLLTLDLDSVPEGIDPWDTVTMVLGYAAVIYSTHSNTKEAPRLRLVMPLNRDVTPDEYTAIARKVADDVGIDYCDDTTFEAARLMYWPSCSLDAVYVYQYQDGPWINADEQLARYHDWRDSTEWPVSSRQLGIMTKLAKKQGDPRTKPGAVGAFCRVYSIEDAIQDFLPEIYSPCMNGRYTFAGGSTSGGLVLYNDPEGGQFAYSHHGTDPCSGRLCNAFDLVRIHLFGDLDADVKPGTPVNRLPSFAAMTNTAMQDESVKQEIVETKLADVIDAFNDDFKDLDPENPEATPDFDWLKELDVDNGGNLMATVRNSRLILANDPNIKGQYYFDEFQEKGIVCGDLPWRKLKDRASDAWTDSDDAGLHEYIESRYKIDHVSKLREAIDLAMLGACRHPIREYLSGLVWDGAPRADSLFIEYLGAEDTAYTREVTRKALLGAVARIFQPGCKHDHMLVLVGPQGCRKSTTLAKLGKSWFSDSMYTVQGKEAYEQLLGAWIIEMGEMAATRKAELEQIKQFISKQVDSYRAAYARRSTSHPRQCAFFGTTNDDEFLRDTTGSRRFWPVQVNGTGYEKGDLITEEIIDQVWAEIVQAYKNGEKWHLSAAGEKAAKKVQADHTEHNSKQGLVEAFLDSKVPKNWDSYTLEQRLLFYSGQFGDEPAPDLVDRETVCALEIWVELFQGTFKTFSMKEAREINGMLKLIDGWEPCAMVRSDIYGRQRGYRRANG